MSAKVRHTAVDCPERAGPTLKKRVTALARRECLKTPLPDGYRFAVTPMASTQLGRLDQIKARPFRGTLPVGQEGSESRPGCSPDKPGGGISDRSVETHRDHMKMVVVLASVAALIRVAVRRRVRIMVMGMIVTTDVRMAMMGGLGLHLTLVAVSVVAMFHPDHDPGARGVGKRDHEGQEAMEKTTHEADHPATADSSEPALARQNPSHRSLSLKGKLRTARLPECRSGARKRL